MGVQTCALPVWIVGVPVIDRHPVETCAEILFHAGQQFAGEGPNIFKFGSIFRRDNEAEVMPIIGAAFGKSITVDRAIAVAEQLGILSVPGDSVTLEIGQVPGERRRGKAVSRSEEHTSELQSLMRISYAVFCLKKKKHTK